MSSLAPARPAGFVDRLRTRLRPGRPRLITVLLLALTAAAPPAYLAQTGGALATGYTIQRLQAERKAWEVRNQQLEVELAKARSLAWIETEAVNRLGMQKAARQAVVQIDVPPPPRTEGRGLRTERAITQSSVLGPQSSQP